MGVAGNSTERPLTALLIAPDRELARQFTESLPAGSGFQILAELRSYPSRQTLEIRLRQIQPEVVLLDVATDLDQAAEVIRWALALHPSLHVVALHGHNDPDAVVRVLHQGASEFLTAPFEPTVQHQAVERIRRLSRRETQTVQHAGKVFVFTSAKPGSGASTLAAQVGFALGRAGTRRILLADLDPMSATVSFYLKLADSEPEGLDLWDRIVPTVHGLDALPSAAVGTPSEQQSALHEFLERARTAYDCILLDLPAVFHHSSLLALPESDRAFLVTTPELPSLHLARKAVSFLAQLGFGRDRVRVLLNRVERNSGLSSSDVEKILNAPVSCSFPNDYFTLDRALVEGRPIAPGCELAREIDNFARRLTEPAAEASRSAQAGTPGQQHRSEIKV